MMYDYTTEEIIFMIQRLEQKLDTVLNELRYKPNQVPTDEWMTVSQLQDFLPNHPSISTIHRWTSQGKIPFIKSGKNLCFCRAEIEKWISEGRDKERQEIEKDAEMFCKERFDISRSPWRN